MRPDEALKLIENEFLRASDLYADLHSNHEGYAVIKEEVDELWDAIKKHKGTKGNKEIKSELIQIGAMVVRFLNNLC
jgi:NTP pyrophosphatase (non-canonical NTP hydrolase)